jgi:lysophospholipase L1-like esterase
VRGFRFLVLFAGIFFGLVASEIIVRVFHMAPAVGFVRQGRYRLSANEKLGYEPTPGLYHKNGPIEFFDYYANETNALGYRDYDHSLQNNAGTLRIIVLGDSVAGGWGIKEYTRTFPSILEAELRSRGMKSEVLNFSVTGYNTQQEIETLKEKGLTYKPDVVVLAYCLNDRTRSDASIMRTLLQNEKNSGKLNFDVVNPFLTKSALYRFVRYRLLSDPSTSKDRREERYKLVSQDNVAQYFQELESLSKINRFSVLVVIFPLFFDELANYRFTAEHNAIRELCKANQFQTLDLVDPLKECEAQHHTRVSIDPFHPNYLGHLCAGKATAAKVQSVIDSQK